MRDVRLDSCELKAIMDRAAKLGQARLRCALQPGAQGRNGSNAEPFSQHAGYISLAVGRILPTPILCGLHHQYVRIWFPPGTADRHLIFRHAPRFGNLRSALLDSKFRRSEKAYRGKVHCQSRGSYLARALAASQSEITRRRYK